MIYDICRVIHKGQRRHIDSSAEIYIFLNTTIYAEVSQSQFESIRVAGRSCNQSLNLMFDQVAQVAKNIQFVVLKTIRISYSLFSQNEAINLVHREINTI